MQRNEPGNIKRYTNFNLPAYKFVPGKVVHPSKNTGQEHIPVLPKDNNPFSCMNWQKSERYLYAIDLFNHGCYWEVHEVLEGIWHRVGKDSTEGKFIQGLIQLSVALLKKIQDNIMGVNRLSEKAFPKLCTQSGVYLGIDVELLIHQSKKHFENDSAPPVISLMSI